MNEKRAFLMMVGLGLLAIITNGVALISDDGLALSNVDQSDQLAAVVTGGVTDLAFQSLSLQSDGSIAVWVKSSGPGSIAKPTIYTDGVCATLTYLGVDPVEGNYSIINKSCASINSYPVNPGASVKIIFPARPQYVVNTEVRVGIDGVEYDPTPSPNGTFVLGNSANKIIETNELNNNYSIANTPDKNLAVGKLIYSSTNLTGGPADACLINTLDGFKNCCNKTGMIGGSCQGFGGRNPEFSLATDGNPNTFWCSSKLVGAGDPPEWVYVDLGSNQSIGQVVINQATSSLVAGKPVGPYLCGQAIDYQIQVSTDKTNWVSVATKTGDYSAVKSVVLTTPTTARYVRLYATRIPARRLSVSEFKVFPTFSSGNILSAANPSNKLASLQNTILKDTGYKFIPTNDPKGGFSQIVVANPTIAPKAGSGAENSDALCRDLLDNDLDGSIDYGIDVDGNGKFDDPIDVKADSDCPEVCGTFLPGKLDGVQGAVLNYKTIGSNLACDVINEHMPKKIYPKLLITVAGTVSAPLGAAAYTIANKDKIVAVVHEANGTTKADNKLLYAIKWLFKVFRGLTQIVWTDTKETVDQVVSEGVAVLNDFNAVTIEKVDPKPVSQTVTDAPPATQP